MRSIHRAVLATFVSAFALADSAAAQAPTRIGPRERAGSGAPAGDGPVWTQTVTADDIRYAYPVEARKAKMDGSAVITCKATEAGRMNACTLVSEAPEGAGFGEAALKLGGRFRMKSLDLQRKPVAGRDFTIPISFSTRPGASGFQGGTGLGASSVQINDPRMAP